MKISCLILHAGALGDCVLTLYGAMALRQAGHKITMAARSPIAAWAARRGMIDESISLDCLSPLLWGAGPDCDGVASDALALVERFDRIISFLGGVNETVANRLTELCGPEHVIHIDPRPNEKTLAEGKHITHQWYDEICRLNSDLKSEISDLKLPLRTINARNTFPAVIVHPGSGGLAKCCPLEAMEGFMCEMLAKGWGARWMIGPDEVERDGPEFRRRLERTASVVFEESVDAATDLVANTNVFIGNDAGMTHVAALAGVNTVALFGPTDPRVWRPPVTNCSVSRFPSVDEPELNWITSLIRLIVGNSPVAAEL